MLELDLPRAWGRVDAGAGAGAGSMFGRLLVMSSKFLSWPSGIKPSLEPFFLTSMNRGSSGVPLEATELKVERERYCCEHLLVIEGMKRIQLYRRRWSRRVAMEGTAYIDFSKTFHVRKEFFQPRGLVA